MIQEQKNLIGRIQMMLWAIEIELEDNDPINAAIAIDITKDEMDKLKNTLRQRRNNYE